MPSFARGVGEPSDCLEFSSHGTRDFPSRDGGYIKMNWVIELESGTVHICSYLLSSNGFEGYP